MDSVLRKDFCFVSCFLTPSAWPSQRAADKEVLIVFDDAVVWVLDSLPKTCVVQAWSQ